MTAPLHERLEQAGPGEVAELIRELATVMHGKVPDACNRMLSANAYLDAAMLLVPEGWRVSRVDEDWRTGRWHAQLSRRMSPAQFKAFDEGRTVGWDTTDTDEGGAASPALALASAIARAGEG